MIKKFFIIILLISSSLVFAEDSIKQKAFGSFTIKFDIQKRVLEITNPNDKSYVLKEFLNDDKTPKEKPKSLAEKNLKKRTADDYTYVDSIKTITIHGTIEELETVYNALNSEEDCKNFNLRDMGFDYSSASSIRKLSSTGKIYHNWDLIICVYDWDYE